MFKRIIFLLWIAPSLSASPFFMVEKRLKIYEITAEMGSREHEDPDSESPAPISTPLKTAFAIAIAGGIIGLYCYNKLSDVRSDPKSNMAVSLMSLIINNNH
jgi:hypothetical protein